MAEPWDSGVVETYSGKRFNVFDPDADDINLDDVAAGLAHTCRFGGHCRRFYSVAQHSMNVSREVDESERLKLIALLHDAAEAYLGDIPRPVKMEFDEIPGIEDSILDAVWESIGIDPPTESEWTTVMEADDLLLAYEASELLEAGDWAADPPDLEYSLRADSIESTRKQFLQRARKVLEQSEIPD